MPMAVWNRMFSAMEMLHKAPDHDQVVYLFVAASKKVGLPTPSLKRTKLNYDATMVSPSGASKMDIERLVEDVEAILDEHQNSIFGIQGTLGKQEGPLTSSYTSVWSALRCITSKNERLKAQLLDMGKRVTKGVGDTAVIALAAKRTAEAVEAEVNRFMLMGGGGKLSALDGSLGTCEAYVGCSSIRL